MFAFVAHATLVRPSLRAYSNANRAIFSEPLALISLSVMPVMTISTLYFRGKIRAASNKFHKIVGEYLAFLNEHFGGMLIVQLFGLLLLVADVAQALLQRDPRTRDRVHRLLRHPRRDAPLEHLRAGFVDLPVDGRAGRLHHPAGRVDALGPDPVAGDQGDPDPPIAVRLAHPAPPPAGTTGQRPPW